MYGVDHLSLFMPFFYFLIIQSVRFFIYLVFVFFRSAWYLLHVMSSWPVTCYLDEFGNGIAFMREGFNGTLPTPFPGEPSMFTVYVGGVNTYISISLPDGFCGRLSNIPGCNISCTSTVSKDFIDGDKKFLRVVLYNHSFRNRRIVVGDAIVVIDIDGLHSRLEFGGGGVAPLCGAFRRLCPIGRSVAPSAHVCRRLQVHDA